MLYITISSNNNRNNSNEQHQRNHNVYNNRNSNNNNNAVMFGTSSFNKNKSMLNICRIKTPKNEYLTERYNVNKRFVYFHNENNSKAYNNHNNANNELSPISNIKRAMGTINGHNNKKHKFCGSDLIETKQEELKNIFRFQNYKNVLKNNKV